MAFKYAYWLPILVALLFGTCFITTYLIAVYNKDVYPLFPFISDTGTWSPESCIFGIFLNVGAIVQALIVYIRYRQVRDLCEKNDFKMNIKKYNLYSSFLGYIAAFGVSIVGNFQETNIIYMHMLGAAMAFGLGAVYLNIQTLMSIKIYPILGSKLTNWIRVIFTLTCSLSSLLTGTFAGLALLNYHGKDISKWNIEDGGYNYRMISAICEWVLAVTTILYLSLYTKEFRLLSISEPVVLDS